MMLPPSAPEIAQLGQALMLGTRKRPITLPPAVSALIPATSSLSPAMLALVLAGQHARFERPAAPSLAPALESDLKLHADPRPMLSDASRRLLKQLLTLAKGDAPEAVLTACRDRATARGLRLHPFDLPVFAPYLRGGETQAASLPASSGADDVAALDAESWKAMPPQQRVDALRRFRFASPDAARALLEETFRSEAAPDRAAFLGVMAVHLTAADLPFLEAAAKDRADAARTTAQRLAGSIPGTDAYRNRLSGAAGMFITRGVTDEAKRKKHLSTGLAAMKGAVGHSAFQTLEGLRPEDLAGRLGLTLDAFVDALPIGEDILILPLLPAAIAEGNAALCAGLIRRLSGLRALVVLWSHRPDGLDAPDHLRPALAEALISLAVRGQFPDAQTLHTFYRINRGPLLDALAAKLLASKIWRTHIADLTAPNADNKTPNAVKEAALLIPGGQLDAFLESIAALPPHLSLPARIFAEFCQSLGRTSPVASLTQSR